MKRLLATHPVILAEAAILEQLRRSDGVPLHPRLANAPLIREARGRQALERLYRDYWSVARRAGWPFLMCTPTWRANRERCASMARADTLNADAVRFMQGLRERFEGARGEVRIGGLIGCRNDCYRPEQGLSSAAAEAFHAWQIGQLAAAGVDYLIAQTLPALDEAIGIARAMAATGVPFIISFVIDRQGRLLDGHSLTAALDAVDAATGRAALGFMINCAYPDFLCAAHQPPALFERLIGIQANASALDHCELDGADQVQAEAVAQWGQAMLRINRQQGVPILGGCCGTGVAHLEYLRVHRLTPADSAADD